MTIIAVDFVRKRATSVEENVSRDLWEDWERLRKQREEDRKAVVEQLRRIPGVFYVGDILS